MTINTQWVQVPNGQLQIAAYCAAPGRAGSFPAVIVIQEVFGVNAHIRSVVNRLAEEGYVAIAPAIYQRTAPGFDVGYSSEELAIGRQHKDQTTAAELLSDIQATIRLLRQQDHVRGDRIGAIGFCFGGHVAYLAATLPDIQATASFYGAGITRMTPGGGAPTLSRTAEIQGTLYAFFGTQDPLISIEEIDQVETELQRCQIRHRVFRYPTDHGFFCEQRPSYNPTAAADAWEQVKGLFAQSLQG